MNDVAKSKYLLSGEADKFIKKILNKWYVEDRLFGHKSEACSTFEQALEVYHRYEEVRKNMVEAC